MKKIIFILFMVSVLIFLGCDNDGYPTDHGTCDEEHEQRCFENVAQMCEGGKWKDVEDCTTKTCAIVVIDEIVDVKCISF